MIKIKVTIGGFDGGAVGGVGIPQRHFFKVVLGGGSGGPPRDNFEVLGGASGPPKDFFEVLGVGSGPPRDSFEVLGGGSRPPKDSFEVLGGGYLGGLCRGPPPGCNPRNS